MAETEMASSWRTLGCRLADLHAHAGRSAAARAGYAAALCRLRDEVSRLLAETDTITPTMTDAAPDPAEDVDDGGDDPRVRAMALRLADAWGERVHVLDRDQDVTGHVRPSLTYAALDSQVTAWQRANASYTVAPSGHEQGEGDAR